MGARLSLLGLAAALALVAIAALVGAGRGGEAATGEREEGAASAPRSAADLAAPGAAAPAESETAAADPIETAARVAIAGSAPEAPADAVVAVLPVVGVLLDEGGRPVPDARIVYEPVRNLVPDSGLGYFQITHDGGEWGQHAVRTDVSGTFAFEGSDAANGGTLTYGFGLFVRGDTLRHSIDETGYEQVLRLPPRADGPAVVIATRDQGGAYIAPILVEVEHLGGTPEGAHRLPADDDVRPHASGVVIVPIAPGEYRVWLAGADTEVREQRFTVPAEGPDVELTMALRRFDGAGWSLDLLNDQGRTWPDVANGLDEWLPETRRGFDAGGSNRHFGHTITEHGEGQVKSALLVLTLEATHDVPTNDYINLEFLGDPEGSRFSWGKRISELPGAGGWGRGRRATFRLDLARLPSKKGPVDLRPLLADGRLDVVVADDTIVRRMQLSVLR